MPYAAPFCSFCKLPLGKVDKDFDRRKEEHLKFDCPKYKRLQKKQNQRNLQPLPQARVIGQAGIPSLGKRKP
jgi:hypothetical protein